MINSRHLSVASILLTMWSAPALAQQTIAVTATPITHFNPDKPDQVRFGSLLWIGGVQYASKEGLMGGLSGIRLLDHGKKFMAVSDQGNWFRGMIQRSPEGIVRNLVSVAYQALRDRKGNAITTKKRGDAEGIEIVGSKVLVSFERKHRVNRYKFDFEKLDSKAKRFRDKIPTTGIKSNKGLEAIVALRPRMDAPLGKTPVLVFSEDARDKSGNIRGFISKKNNQWQPLAIRKHEGFRITDSAQLDDAHILVLERQYNPIFGSACQIRKIAIADIHPGAVLDGPVIFSADGDQEIDNMEGLSIWHREDGQIMITMISDNNFSPLQRNVWLEFAYSPQE